MVLEEELTAARARTELAEEREALAQEQAEHADSLAVARAREDAIKARQQEGQLVASARASAIVGLAAAVRAAPGLQPLMERLAQELKGAAVKVGEMSAKERTETILLVRRYASAVRELAAAGQLAMEMERLLLGEPGAIIGVVTDFDRMPMEELVKAAGYMDETLKRAQDRGLVLLEGGLSKSAGGASGSGQG